MRGASGDSRFLNNTLETINAAATAIASAETRAPPARAQKRSWGSFWSIYWCFGSHKHRKKVGHAVLVPEPTEPENNVPASQNVTQAPTITLPFVAPPSSPASFLQSEPPSAIQSPVGVMPLNSISANMYSPGGPASIFAIGPYAYETQLVSPPVFSTFTTEPSTAPITPPPESVHLTTPSSPEVPFAQLLEPNLRNGDTSQKFLSSHYEFNSYQLHPGSPVGHLISPSSGISGSGTSSPFQDRDFAVIGPQFLQFLRGDSSKLMDRDKFLAHEWESRQGSGTLTPKAARPKSQDDFTVSHPPKLLNLEKLSDQEWESRHSSNTSPRDDTRPKNCQSPEGASHNIPGRGCQNELVDHRVSFELALEDGRECVEKKPLTTPKSASDSGQDSSIAITNDSRCEVGEMPNEISDKASEEVEETQEHEKHKSETLGSAKEFHFDNAEGTESHRTTISTDWWANDKVVGNENEPLRNWSFFPMMQPGVS